MTVVLYSTKNHNGLLVEHKRVFKTASDASNFLKTLKDKNLIGKPIIEVK